MHAQHHNAPASLGLLADVVDVAGVAVRLQWLGLHEGKMNHNLAGLDSVLQRLLDQHEDTASGGVLVASDPTGAVIGAAGFDLTTSDCAYVAVAVTSAWQHHGLGRHLARRVVTTTHANGCRYLTCRCDRRPDDVARAAALFGQTCVGSARVGFHHVLVMRLAG